MLNDRAGPRKACALPSSWDAAPRCARENRRRSCIDAMAALTFVPAPVRRRRQLALAVLLAVLLMASMLYVAVNRLTRPAAPAVAADRLTQMLDRALLRERGAASPGVAIRPLAPADAAPEALALAEGVCASLAERLARLPTLRVVPCRSTSVAMAVQMDDAHLARLLAVRYVLEGRLEPLTDDRLHVRIALREAGSGRAAWQIDERIVAGALQTLPARVAEATGRAIGQADPSPPEPDLAPEVYAKFLLARQLANKVSMDERRRALALLDEVLAAEPNHAPSLYIRQNLRGRMLGNTGDKCESVAELNAARAANVAEGLALARRLVAADPYDFRGQVLLLADEIEIKQWPQGFERMDRILERHARVPGLMRLAARLHLHAGYLARARELALAAAQMNALDGEAIEILAALAGIERRDAEFRELLALAQQIGHQGLGPLQVFEARRREDWASLERAYAAYIGWGGKWPADWVPRYVGGLADPAARAAAVAVLDGHDEATRQHFSGYFVEYALLGELPRSLASVQRHAKRPPASWMQYLWWPELAALRAAPGFGDAMRDLGAAALWEARGAPDLCKREPDGRWACR
jgi:TolB-like protein